MSDLLLKNYNAHYATGSVAFTETLRKIIGMREALNLSILTVMRKQIRMKLIY